MLGFKVSTIQSESKTQVEVKVYGIIMVIVL